MVYIQSDECVRCGACVTLCPAKLFTCPEGSAATFAEDKVQLCIHCGHCYAICPSGAIALDGVNPKDMPEVSKVSLEPAQRKMLFHGRRSIRNYKKDLVPEAVIAEALQDAAYAPTGGNMQNIEWVLVQDAACLQAIIAQTAEWLRHSGLSRYARYVEGYDAGCDLILRGAPQAVFAHVPRNWAWGAQDASGAVTYLDLSLHARGIGTCWTGLVIAAAAKGGVPALPVPAEHVVLGGLMLGYAKSQFVRFPPRKPVRLRIV